MAGALRRFVVGADMNQKPEIETISGSTW